MPRYYFDVHDGQRFTDERGQECADLEAAQGEAMARLSRHLQKWPCKWNGGMWTMIVRDDGGNAVATLVISAQS